MESFGEVGVNFPLQLSSEQSLLKLKIKKLSLKIDVKNKKSSLGLLFLLGAIS